jgi:hypothetical protein
VQACLLELDLGTLTLKRFRRKLRAFELDLAQGLGAVLPVPSFEVLVLTHSQPRLQQLWRAARDEVPPERWGACSFGTFDLLEPGRFREAHWITAENDLVPLLYDDAFADAAAEPAVASAEADHETADAAPSPATRASGAKGADRWSRSEVGVVRHLARLGALCGADLRLDACTELSARQ